jgi:predicted phage-related endonuclease
MWVSQVDVTYVAALVNMELVERRIERDTERINYLTVAAKFFMDSLDRNEAPPIDGSTHTYQAVRELHPDIEAEDVEIPESLATSWLDAKYDAEAISETEQRLKSEIAALTGNARRAVWNGTTLFTRQSRGGGTPYLVAARNLPTIGRAA